MNHGGVHSYKWTVYNIEDKQTQWNSIINPFKKQWTEIFCSRKNTQVISKVTITIKIKIKIKVLSYKTGEIYYAATDSNKHDTDS